jgi:MFS family permease
LFTSSGVSNLSDGMLQAALPLLAASLTRDPLAVSAMASLAFLPWLLFAIPAGAVVDRVNRRTAMAVANVARAGMLIAMAVATAAGAATLPLLYATAFVLGCAEVVYDNAARAMLPAVVGKSGLERGNSLLATAESVGNIFLGAPIGAWLFAIAVSIPFWSNAVAYLVSAGLILTVAGRFRAPRAAPTRLRADIAVGLRWLMHHRLLRTLMVTTGLAGLLQSMINGILVLFALEELGLSERGFGIALAVAGVGAIVGSVASPRLTAVLGRTGAMGACEIASAPLMVLLGLFPQPVFGVALFALSSALGAAFNVQIMSVRQAIIPEHLFGRVQGAYRTVIWGGIPIGTLAGGALAGVVGLSTVIVLSGAASIVVAFVTYAVLRRHRAEIDAAFEIDAAVDIDTAVAGDGAET